MKELILTRGCKALVDDEDWTRANQFKWCLVTPGKNKYAVRQANKKSIYLHRFILNYSGQKFVDHINGDGLDNRKENLRLACRLGNSRNAIKKSQTKRFKGIYWQKINKKWVAEITVNYKKICLGSFVNEIEAAHAYNDAALKYFGEFAKLNLFKEE